MNNTKQKHTITALDKYLKERTPEITDSIIDNFSSIDDEHSANRLVRMINSMATSESLLLAFLEIAEDDHQFKDRESFLAKYEDDFRKILEEYVDNNLRHSKAFKNFQSHIRKVIKK